MRFSSIVDLRTSIPMINAFDISKERVSGDHFINPFYSHMRNARLDMALQGCFDVDLSHLSSYFRGFLDDPDRSKP